MWCQEWWCWRKEPGTSGLTSLTLRQTFPLPLHMHQTIKPQLIVIAIPSSSKAHYLTQLPGNSSSFNSSVTLACSRLVWQELLALPRARVPIAETSTTLKTFLLQNSSIESRESYYDSRDTTQPQHEAKLMSIISGILISFVIVESDALFLLNVVPNSKWVLGFSLAVLSVCQTKLGCCILNWISCSCVATCNLLLAYLAYSALLHLDISKKLTFWAGHS